MSSSLISGHQYLLNQRLDRAFILCSCKTIFQTTKYTFEGAFNFIKTLHFKAYQSTYLFFEITPSSIFSKVFRTVDLLHKIYSELFAIYLYCRANAFRFRRDHVIDIMTSSPATTRQASESWLL